MQQVMHVKVIGERNTGTNFLVELINSNTDLINLIHPDKSRCRSKLKQLISRYPELKKSALSRKMVMERLIDAERENDFHNNFGWKHAAINTQRMQESSLFEDTLFLCLIRNPWRFVSALHRRPYNYLPKAKKKLESFIQSPLLTNNRDGLQESILANPVDLWNKKVASYQKFQLIHPERVKIIYYEELIIDIDNFLRMLAPFCQLSEQINIPFSSTKKDNKTFSDYKEEAESYSPLKSIGAKCTNLIAKKLDKKVFKHTIYRNMPNFKGIF